MVKLSDDNSNKIIKVQNEELIKSLKDPNTYGEEIINKALKVVQDPNFFSEGVFKLVLDLIKQGNSIDDLIKGGGEISDEIKDIIDGIKNEIKENSDRIDSDIDGLENSITIYRQDYERTTKEIYQRIQSNEISGNLANVLISLKNTIEGIKERYESDKKTIDEITKDGVLTYEEKLRFTTIWETIKNEYPTFIDEFNKNEVDSSKLVGKYTKLSSSIVDLYLDKDTNTVIDRDLIITNLQEYYDSLIECLNNLYAKKENTVNGIIDDAVDGASDLGGTYGKVTSSSMLLDSIQSFLRYSLSDNKLTPSEKDKLKKDYYNDIFNLLLPEDIKLATKYKVSYENLQQSATDIRNLVDRYQLFEHEENTEITDVEGFINTFTSFYENEILMYNEIIKILQNKVNEVEEDVNNNSTSIDQTDKKLQFVAQNVKMIGEKIETSRAQYTLLSDRITQIVSGSTIDRDNSDSNDAVNSVGSNLYIALNSKSGYINPNTGIPMTTVNGSRYSEYIKSAPNIDYTLSLSNNSIDNTIWIYWYDKEKKLIKVDSKSSMDRSFSLSVISPKETSFAIVTSYQTENSLMQFEVGSTQTPYEVSPFDSINSVILAKKEVENKKRDQLEASNNYNLFSDQQKDHINKLNNILSDSVVTPEEKTVIGNILNDINRQHQYVSNKLTSYNDTSSLINFDQYLLTITQFTNSLEETESSVNISSPTNVMNNYTRFYNERDSLMGKVSQYISNDLKKAQEKLSKSTETALNAEYIKNELKRQLENQAKKIKALRNFSDEEDIYSEETIQKTKEISKDNQINPVEKVDINDILGRMKVEDEWYINQADILEISRSAFSNSRNTLIDYLNPMLTVNALYDTSKIESDSFDTKIEVYFNERKKLLKSIITANEGLYENLQHKYISASEQYDLKNEELLEYQKAIEDAKNEIGKLNDDINELKNRIQYTVRLVSSKGDIFTNNTVDTTLTAYLLKNGIDKTNELPDSAFVWSKRDIDGNIDIEWNNAHVNVGNEIKVTNEDLNEKAIFEVEIFEVIE